MNRLRTLILVIGVVTLPGLAQTWKGILAPSRAIDWSQAGIPGGIPSSTWARCGSVIAAGAGVATINRAIQKCAADHYVELGPGTFKLNGMIVLKDRVAVRGQGSNSTFLLWSGHSNCNGQYAQFCLAGSNASWDQHNAAWTAGFGRGETRLTLSNSQGITAKSTAITLDQRDEAVDTGNIWNNVFGNNGGGARTSGTCGAVPCSQQQQVLVTACVPSCNRSGQTVVTISPGLYADNWRTGQTPGAFWVESTAYRMGVEDLSTSNTAVGFVVFNCYECWIRGVRSINAGRAHIQAWASSRNIYRDNYLYQNFNHVDQSYGIELYYGNSDTLIENNICQQVTDSCPNNDGGGAGNVAAYNFSIATMWGTGQNGLFQLSDYDHASGQFFWLREGNIGTGFASDYIHGSHHFTTLFRNSYLGWQPLCGATDPAPCLYNQGAALLEASSRYFNAVGNVMGAPYFHRAYQCYAGGADGDRAVWVLGNNAPNCGNWNTGVGQFCQDYPKCAARSGAGDPLTRDSLMRWGNYTACRGEGCNVVRWESTEKADAFADTTGTSSRYAALPNPEEATAERPWPASFYLSAKPAWWGALPWPAIGPDVREGNVGICTAGKIGGVSSAGLRATAATQCGVGGAYSTSGTDGFGGHVNLNPAARCYFELMGGPADGSGAVLGFDADRCYGSPER